MSFVLLTLLVLWAVPIYAIVDAVRRPTTVWEAMSTSQVLWVVLCIVFGIFAALPYFVVIRPKLIVASQA